MFRIREGEFGAEWKKSDRFVIRIFLVADNTTVCHVPTLPEERCMSWTFVERYDDGTLVVEQSSDEYVDERTAHEVAGDWLARFNEEQELNAHRAPRRRKEAKAQREIAAR